MNKTGMRVSEEKTKELLKKWERRTKKVNSIRGEIVNSLTNVEGLITQYLSQILSDLMPTKMFSHVLRTLIFGLALSLLSRSSLAYY